MSLIGTLGKATGGIIAAAAVLLLLPVIGLIVLIVFLVRQRPQEVTEEAPEPYIRRRILHHTAAPGVGATV